MRIGDAHNGSIIPLHNLVQEAHQPRVGDECANLCFVDGRIANHCNQSPYFCSCSYSYFNIALLLKSKSKNMSMSKNDKEGLIDHRQSQNG